MASYTFLTKPMRHQVTALKKVVANEGVAGLLMDPGTGKSKVVVDYLGMLTQKYGTQSWLITAPLSALDGWPEQFDLHLPKEIDLDLIYLGDGAGSIEDKAERIRALNDRPPLGLRVVLLNHDAFGSRARATKNGKKLKTVSVWDRLVDAIEAWGPDGIAVDESHRIKTHTSNRTKAMERLARRAPKRLILTGTAAPRNPLDFFGQWLFLNRQRFGTDWNAFRFEYARWGGFHEKEPILWLNTADMRKKILADAIVVRKEDALDLPPVTEVPLPVRLSPKEAKAYVEMGTEMLVSLDNGEEAIAPIPITKMLRQRQLTGGFVGYEREDGGHDIERIGESKARVCMDKLSSLVEAGEKVVVFAHFRPDLDILQAKTASLKVPVWRVDGSTTKRERADARAGFRDHEGAAVFLAQMRTMSLGVNELSVACNAIFYSMSERRDDFDQAIDRLDRQGQTRPVTIWHLTVPDSVDELLLQGHQEKLALEHAITTRKEAEHYLTLGQGA